MRLSLGPRPVPVRRAAAAGPDFNASLTEGQIILPANAQCTVGDEMIDKATVEEIEAAAGDPALALRGALHRLLLARVAAEVGDADARAAERVAVEAAFGGSQDAYIAELQGRGVTRQAAKNALVDLLRRQAVEARLTVEEPGREWSSWITRSQKEAIREAVCLGDDVPRAGTFDWSVVLPFLTLPDPSVSIQTDRRVVTRGAKVTLSGVVESVRPNEAVAVYAVSPTGGSYNLVGESTVGQDGAWSLDVRPREKGTWTYRALSKSAASQPLALRVKGAKGKK